MWLRPVCPDDAPALQRAYARMTPSDKHARLFATIPELTDEAARRFCTTGENELCLVLESEDEPGEILGGGRLMADPKGASAEFAVSLRSDQKGMGLGRALLTNLLELAPAMGVDYVWGSILASNAPMRGLAQRLGFEIQRDPDDFRLVKAVKAVRASQAIGLPDD
jgi:L-amino acid N-acyltransferase YncA